MGWPFFVTRLITGCSPVEHSPCEDGFAAWSEAGERFSHLEDASDATQSMVLHVCAGTHHGTRDRILMFDDDPEDAEETEYTIIGAGESETILDGEGVVSPLLFYARATVSQLTIQNGGYDFETLGGEMYVRSGGGARVSRTDVVFEHVTFLGNSAFNAGAIEVYSGSVTLRDSRMVANDGRRGGAVSLSAAGSTLTSERTEWSGNRASDVSFHDADGGVTGSFDDDGSGTFSCVWDTGTCR